jgi:hypothetical protein
LPAIAIATSGAAPSFAATPAAIIVPRKVPLVGIVVLLECIRRSDGTRG